jgi:hypothetical protein
MHAIHQLDRFFGGQWTNVIGRAFQAGNEIERSGFQTELPSDDAGNIEQISNEIALSSCIAFDDFQTFLL